MSFDPSPDFGDIACSMESLALAIEVRDAYTRRHCDRQCQRLHQAGDVAEVGGGIEAHGVATWDGTWDRVAESRKAGKAVVLMGTAWPAALSPH